MNRIFSRMVIPCLCLGVLTACVTPEQAAVNRDAHMSRLFPNPSDRAGLHLVFPIDRIALVTYYPNQISDTQALQKMARYCQARYPESRAVKTKENRASQVALADGQEIAAVEMTVECEG